MADLASSAVTTTRSSSSTLSNGITLYSKACSVVLSTQGSTSNKVLATAFGLSTFEESSRWSKSDDTSVICAGVSGDRTYLLLKADGSGTPTDIVAGTYICYVKGF